MTSAINHYINQMTENDQTFFKLLGRQIATLRKAQHITQVQLAQFLGISQQYLQAFEAGRRKVPSSMLPKLAQLFGVSLEQLLGMPEPTTKRGPTPKLQRQIEQLQQLPKTQQRFVMQMLDTVLQQAS
jgi:transcriptional regulator with XRE-family HTH domain